MSKNIHNLTKSFIVLVFSIITFSLFAFNNTSIEVLTCNLGITTGNGSVTIDGLNASHVILKLFNADWNTTYECVDDCGNPLTINNLEEGTYYLSAKLFNDNWQPTCEQTESVTITNDGGSGSGGGGSGGSCDISWTTSSGSISINGLDDAGHTIFKLFDPSWSIVYDCFDNCPDPLTINNLTNGATYHLSYQLYNNSWQPLCDDVVDVVIDGGLSLIHI